MDVAVIDWKDSKFEKDVLYEDINAPQWIDFSDADPPVVDDEAWFCRPDCNHPKTVEDFFTQRTPDSAKLQRSSSVSAVSRLSERNSRDAALKKRGFPPTKNSKSTKNVYDSENHNPNYSTPPINKAKSLKEMIKSSSEKNQVESVLLQKEESPRLLKSTLSARNLFSGKDIFSQVSEFCNELKRLAIRTKDSGEKVTPKKSQVAAKKQEMGVLQEIKSERMPLLEVKKEKYDEIQKQSNAKEKLTKKKLNCESENTPAALNMKIIRGKEENRVLQIRTNPPSPQCFSATKTTPSKASRLRPQERGVLHEIEEISISKEVKKEVKGNNNTTSQTAASLSPQNEASKGLDVFWIFKPCTLSS